MEPINTSPTTLEPTHTDISSVPPSMSPQKANKTLIILLISLIVLLALSTGFLAFQNYKLQKQVENAPVDILESSPAPLETPTPLEEVSNSKTYTDGTYGFSFSYPEDWEIRDALIVNQSLSQYANDKVFLGLAPIAVKEDYFGMIRITGTPEEQIIEQSKTFPEGAPNIVVSETATTFLDYPATEILTKNPISNVEDKIIIFTKDNLVYLLRGGDSNSIVEGIISSFAFR